MKYVGGNCDELFTETKRRTRDYYVAELLLEFPAPNVISEPVILLSASFPLTVYTYVSFSILSHVISSGLLLPLLEVSYSIHILIHY